MFFELLVNAPWMFQPPLQQLQQQQHHQQQRHIEFRQGTPGGGRNLTDNSGSGGGDLQVLARELIDRHMSASLDVIDNTPCVAETMISAICWVPKGAPKVMPVVADPPSKEEIEEILKSGVLERSGDSDAEGDEGMEVDTSKEVEEVAHALAAAEALGQVKGNSGSTGFPDISDGLQELNMDQYDDEENGIELFGSGMGDAYYPSNEMDPYLNKNDDDDDDDDEEEIEDLAIKPTDAVILCARCEDEVGHLEIWVYEELEDESNMYVHHDIILPAFPLCTAWLDCNPKNGDKGNLVAVGSMDTAIEIWDLDLLDEVQPSVILGGTMEKKKGKKSAAKYKKGSHRDSVLGLAWNKEVRNVLASASGDKSVKVWDVVTAQCVLTLDHHSDKVQAVEWNQCSPEILLSGSFDRSVVMMDMKSNGRPANKWTVTSDVESIKWDPHNEHLFVASLDDGTVQGYDVRAASMDSDSRSKACFTLHAHDEACCSVSYSPSAPNLLATGSKDKMVKLWDLSNNQPSCVASKNPKAGAVFSLAFSEDNPFSLAIGGSKGKLKVWDTLSEDSVLQKYGKLSNRKMGPKAEA